MWSSTEVESSRLSLGPSNREDNRQAHRERRQMGLGERREAKNLDNRSVFTDHGRSRKKRLTNSRSYAWLADVGLSRIPRRSRVRVVGGGARRRGDQIGCLHPPLNYSTCREESWPRRSCRQNNPHHRHMSSLKYTFCPSSAATSASENWRWPRCQRGLCLQGDCVEATGKLGYHSVAARFPQRSRITNPGRFLSIRLASAPSSRPPRRAHAPGPSQIHPSRRLRSSTSSPRSTRHTYPIYTSTDQCINQATPDCPSSIQPGQAQSFPSAIRFGGVRAQTSPDKTDKTAKPYRAQFRPV